MIKLIKIIYYQPFHLVSPSPWPLIISFSLIITIIRTIIIILKNNVIILILRFLLTLIIIYQWWRDTNIERSYQGFHTLEVQKGLKLGIILFIVSELFFFLRVFWCYIHIFLSPAIEIGQLWPPKNIQIFNPYQIPLLNTIILLSSGVSITWCHHSLLIQNHKDRFKRLLFTVILGIIFTFIQYLEYKEASFTISDRVFGSIFFFGTGFHGLHVIIGTIFLIIHLNIIKFNYYYNRHCIGLEIAIWYWHFVDVIWLFLYLLIYFLAS